MRGDTVWDLTALPNGCFRHCSSRMQIIYNWFWSMLASGGQNEFMPWFSDNWIKIVLILLAAGLIIDYTIYLMRWQPYHIWLTALRRARGYVSRPFAKETAKPHYAGYRRVLEDVEGAQPAPGSARAPERTAHERVRVYEAEPVKQPPAAARDDSAFKRPLVRPPQDARPASDRQYMRPESAPAPVATDSAFAYEDDFADDYAPDTALDAEGYVPESVIAPPAPDADKYDEPMFSAPPTFARSARETAPVYGRVYQSPGQPILPLGMDEDERRPQVELPGMDVPGAVQDAAAGAPVQAERVAPAAVEPAPQPVQVEPVQAVKPAPVVRPAAVEPAPQPVQVEPVQAVKPAPVVRPAAVEPAPQPVQAEPVQAVKPAPVQPVRPTQKPVASKPAPARRPTPDGYKSRRARAQSAAAAQSVEAEQQAQPAQPKPIQPARPAQPVNPAQPPRPAQSAPRSISVRETGATRDMDFDDDM